MTVLCPQSASDDDLSGEASLIARDRKSNGGLEARQSLSMKMCTVLPIPSFAGTLSRPIGTYIVNLRRANCQTLLRGHRRRDGMERVGVREMRPHSDLQKSGIDNADLRTEAVHSLLKRLFTGLQDANRPSFRRPDSSFESGFSQSQYIGEFKSAILRTEGVHSLRKRLSTGQQDANEPPCRRPDSAVESGFSQSQYIADFQSAILRTEGVHSLRKHLSTGLQDANRLSLIHI